MESTRQVTSSEAGISASIVGRVSLHGLFPIQSVPLAFFRLGCFTARIPFVYVVLSLERFCPFLSEELRGLGQLRYK